MDHLCLRAHHLDEVIHLSEDKYFHLVASKLLLEDVHFNKHVLSRLEGSNRAEIV